MAWADNGSFSDFNCGPNNVSGADYSGSYSNINGRQGSGFRSKSHASRSQGVNEDSHVKIADLSLGMPGAMIIGVVIAKEDPRHFPNKKDPTSERWVMSFTVRDSPDDIINVTAWGGEQFISDLAAQFRISDVVEICQPGIQSKPTDGSDERYRPSNSSMYQLNIGESRGTVSMYNGGDLSDYNQLSHIPVKASNDFYTIDDIMTNGDALHREVVGMLVMIKKVCPYKDIVTKDGRPMKRCEIRVFDDTAPHFEIVLWSEELIFLAQNWLPKDQVLFIADLKITRSDFKKTMIGTAGSKTIFTVNPDTPEAYTLYKYGQSVELADDAEGETSNKTVDFDAIKDVQTIEQVKERMSGREDGGAVDYSLSFAFISTLNVDNEDPLTVIAIRCNKCRFRVDRETRTCTNVNCQPSTMCALGGQGPETDTMFDMRVACSDHTGTITGCYLSGEVAEKLLGCTVNDFLSMDETQKANLKWTVMLERCKIYFKLTQPSFDRTTPIVRILSCHLADHEEALRSMS